MENRSDAGKLQERKGGAVLAGMEIGLGKGFDAKPTRALRILLDGDSTIGVGAFVGEAAYSILQEGNNCYLANMKDACTCISYQPAKKEPQPTMLPRKPAYRIGSCFSRALQFLSSSQKC